LAVCKVCDIDLLENMSAAAAAAAATMPAQAASGQKLMASVKKEKNQHIQVVVRCRSDS